MKNKTQIIAEIANDPDKIYSILMLLVDDFETEGCDGSGTLAVVSMNRVREVVGYTPLDESDDNDMDDDTEIDPREDLGWDGGREE